MPKCTCVEGQTGPTYLREKDCPEHGLEALKEALAADIDGLRVFKFDDGYQVLARTQSSAEAAHIRHLARKC